MRSLEFTNVRIHTSEGWRDVTSTGPIKSRVDKTGVLADIYGSWEAGADDSTFYMISTGVPGLGRTENTGKLAVQNRESGDPLNGKPLKETVRFDDVATDAYYAKPVSWAVEQGITSGTSKTSLLAQPELHRGADFDLSLAEQRFPQAHWEHSLLRCKERRLLC